MPETSTERKEQTTREKKLLTEALERFKKCADAESEVRARCLDDLVFLAASPDDPAGQWGSAALAQRYRDKRPALVVNRLDQFVQHVANSQRQSRVSARVFPVDDKGDIDTAEVRQGLLRHTEYISSANVVYSTAAFYAVAMGFGYFALQTDYVDPRKFEQEIKLRRIENPFNVYLGPHSMPDGSDAEYGFIFSDMTKEEYEAEHGKESGAGLESERRAGTRFPDGWSSDEVVRVAEYWYTEWENGTLYEMLDGSTRLESEMVEGDERFIAEDKQTGEPRSRETRIPTVKWCKFNASEILEETEWVIPQIPIIKVTGHELNVDGKRILKGIVRNLKDAQRQFNKLNSDLMEAIDSSKSQVVTHEGQLEGHEAEWANLNRPQVLTVKGTDVAGKLTPAPYRLPPNMSIPAINDARMMSADDLKTLTGIYDSALGQRSNETSGRGIAMRQQQTDVANFHFQDNLTTSITHSARMIVNMQPRIYDTARVVRIIGEDDTHKIAKINQEFEEGGKTKNYDFAVGKYDVIATAGPSFATKRKEAAELLTALAAQAPVIMEAAPDLVMKAIDVPYGLEISERLKKTLPPNLQDDKEQPEIPPAVAQKMEQYGQMIEMLTKDLNQTKTLLENKSLEHQSRERIEKSKGEIELLITKLKLDSQEAIAALKAEVDSIKAGMQLDAQAAARAQQASETIESANA